MKYMELATRLAMADIGVKNRHFLFSCVAVRKDGAIVVNPNIRTMMPMVEAHAESRILRKCDRGATLYIVRINRQGNWAMSRPCAQCASLIRNKGVRKVYYSVSSIGKENRIYRVWEPSA